MNYKLTITYDGTQYAGWQKTPLLPSIEGTLQKALERVLQHPIVLQAASRTDRGVHARGQVVNFFSHKPFETSNLRYRLNGLLPKDIAVIGLEEALRDFHPTLQAIEKEYWYEVCYGPVQLPFHQRTSWHYPHPLNIEEMRNAADHLLGTHDFSTFCNERPLWDRSPICHLKSVEIIGLEPHRLRIEIIGDHFLYRMARNIAGTLVYVGAAKIEADQLPEILQSKDRTKSGPTAPAHGLTLHQVFYEH